MYPSSPLFYVAFQPSLTTLYPSLPAPCDCFLPPLIKVLTTTGYVSLQAVYELCFGAPFLYTTWCRVFFFTLPIVPFFFSALIFSYPFLPPSITIHELVTKRKQQCDDSFCLHTMSDFGLVYRKKGIRPLYSFPRIAKQTLKPLRQMLTRKYKR